MHYIYLYTRISDGKQYVGQVLKRRETKREQEHRRNKNDTYFDRAYSKNPDDFLYAIIDEAKDQGEANKKEIYWITELKTKFPDGFNLSNGGGGTCGYVFTDEAKAAVSKGLTGLKRTETQKAEQSERMKKQYADGTIIPGMLGKHHSEETRKKQSESAIVRCCICVETGIKFRSQKDAVTWLRKNGSPKASLGSLASGIKNNKMRYGYHWKYYTEEV